MRSEHSNPIPLVIHCFAALNLADDGGCNEWPSSSPPDEPDKSEAAMEPLLRTSSHDVSNRASHCKIQTELDPWTCRGIFSPPVVGQFDDGSEDLTNTVNEARSSEPVVSGFVPYDRPSVVSFGTSGAATQFDDASSSTMAFDILSRAHTQFDDASDDAMVFPLRTGAATQFDDASDDYNNHPVVASSNPFSLRK